MSFLSNVFLIILTVIASVEYCESVCNNVKNIVECQSITPISSTLISQIEGIEEVTKIRISGDVTPLEVNPNVFLSAVKLQEIIISNSVIQIIHVDTFRNISVRHLRITSNNISSIAVGSFSKLELLESIDLSKNHLRHIPSGLFANLPLTDLSLDQNDLEIIENKALKDLPNLQLLSLYDNKLQWIITNQIISYPQKLKILDLRKNRLTAITNFMLLDLVNLEILNVAFNLISFIEPNSLAQTPKLTHLNLRKNNLKEIDENIFQAGPNYIDQLYLDHNKLMYLPANFFSKMKNLKRVSIEGNPWFCPCLSDVKKVLAKNKIQEVNLSDDYISGNRPVCINENTQTSQCNYVYNNLLSEKYEDGNIKS